MSSERTTARFAARTCHHDQFCADALAAERRARGLRASVVIPARNEAATVGAVAGTLRRDLLDRVGLLDEVLVVDADSEDGTGEAARAAGARVVRQSDVLASAGTARGKGEALWKGLAASEGDLVVFVDADIIDIGPRFVVGLLGPLLVDRSTRFTKASYDRPLQVGDALNPTGGGRVTELLARPVIGAFWPELAWLAQPLAGEYAGDRDLLEALPFVQGYGVELALLVDIVERHGPEVITQVDLGRRVHDPQPIDALGRMASEILHVAVDRLSRQGRVVLADPLSDTFLQPIRDEAGRLAMSESVTRTDERPPLAQWLRTA